MDFTYPEAAETFRSEFRAWLAANLPSDLAGVSITGPEPVDAPTLDRLRAWNRSLAEAGYAAVAWPPEWGGRGAGVMEQVVYAEEMHAARAPGALNPIGLSNIAPSIIEHGTDEQRRTLLPRMLRGDDIWCQGFSEPSAGSDLASLRTAAVRDGEGWVVNGHKTWNTLGIHADWCELLVRTDASVAKHKGITCLLVDMRSPGVEVRPLTTITGEREFCDIVLTDVRVPASATLGPVNEGWRVAMTTLAYERGGVAKLHLGTRAKIRRLIAECATSDPVLRQKLARVYIEGELLKLVGDRALSAELQGRPAGPEGSIAKLLWSQTEQHVAEVATDAFGPHALSGPWARELLYGRSMTIAGGTTEVNKNVVATRVLGLPRD